MGPCAKTTVKCTLVFPDDTRIYGYNSCRNPQEACPRLPGEGYEKCKTICQQESHAEIQALKHAGGLAARARAYIEGHTYACKECQEALFDAGVISISVGLSPPVKCG